MAEYSDIKIGKYVLWSFRNEVDINLLSFFFLQSDLCVNENVKYDELDKDEKPHKQFVFATNVVKAKNRLDSLGYSLSQAKKIIESNHFQCLDYNDYLTELGVDPENWEKVSQERIKKYVTYKKIMNALKRRIFCEAENGEEYIFNYNFVPKTECEKIIFYAINDTYCDSFYGFLFDEIDPIYIFRMILEFFCDDETIKCDLTPLIGWTYSSIDDINLQGISNKIIVLVEGTSDKAILEYSLLMLYPHLKDIFYFMDFEYANSVKRQGGVDSIVNLIKAFIMARLDNKFIALFDNDAVGSLTKEKLLLDICPMPKNIRVFTYPNLPVFKKYPTVSPNGKIVYDDINQKACSIELYLPDTLISKDKSLLPIEWQSQVKIKLGEKIKQSYQGVISNKDEIMRKFISHKERTFNHEEWYKMKKLLESFIFAFI